jgi:hypothetical protein
MPLVENLAGSVCDEMMLKADVCLYALETLYQREPGQRHSGSLLSDA